MEFTEDFERIVKYFYRDRNINELDVSDILMELKKTFDEYGVTWASNYDKLKSMLFSHSNDNNVLKEDGFRTALEEFADSASNNNNNEDSLMNISNNVYPSFIESASFESISSEDYRIRVEDLQNEIEKKDHEIKKLQTDLKFSTQTIQSCEDTISTLLAEKETLSIDLQKMSLKIDDRNYDALAESHNELLKKIASLKDTSGKLQKQNEKLIKNIESLEDEKSILIALQIKDKDEKYKLLSQLTLTEAEIDVLKTRDIKLLQEIDEKQKTIDQLVTFSKKLERDVEESRNFEIYRNPSPDSQGIINEDKSIFKSFILQDESSIEDSEGISFSGKFSFSTSTPYNKLSLMDELIQVNEDSSFNNNSLNTKSFKNELVQTDSVCFKNNETQTNFTCTENKEIQTDCTSETEELNDNQLKIIQNKLRLEKTINKKMGTKMEMFAKENTTLKEKLHKLNKVTKQLKRENKTDRILFTNNATSTQNVEIQTELNVLDVYQEKHINTSHGPISSFCNFWKLVCRKTCRILTVLSFIMAILHLYNVFKYCYYIKSGSLVTIMPWNYITIEEFLMSIFNYEYVNDGPIPF